MMSVMGMGRGEVPAGGISPGCAMCSSEFFPNTVSFSGYVLDTSPDTVFSK